MRNYILALIAIAAIAITGLPGTILVDKLTSRDAAGQSGWKDGCITGSHSYSPVAPMLTEYPFRYKSWGPADTMETQNGNSGTTIQLDSIARQYDTEWNRGFTICRYYQEVFLQLLREKAT